MNDKLKGVTIANGVVIGRSGRKLVPFVKKYGDRAGEKFICLPYGEVTEVPLADVLSELNSLK